MLKGQIIDDLIAEAKAVFAVTLRDGHAYESALPPMKKSVNDAMESRDDLAALIGIQGDALMRGNHENHGRFMATVFQLGLWDLMVRTVLWAYATYKEHGFSYDYFPIELQAWIDAINVYVDRESAGNITAVYRWLISRHTDFIAIIASAIPGEEADSTRIQAMHDHLFHQLLTGDHRECVNSIQTFLASGVTLVELYDQIMRPIMYRVGRLWQENRISVADEHLYSAIMNRAISVVMPEFAGKTFTRGRAIVTSSANEYHDLGPMMIADLIEELGWSVRFLGANTPEWDLYEMIRSFRPNAVAVSVTMPYNLKRVGEMIEYIRSVADWKIHLIVGGQAFNADPELWKNMGADYWAPDGESAVRIFREIESMAEGK